MRCDFHTHTHYSYDSKMSPRQAVDTALARGIDCLAICDHGKIEGAKEASDYASGRPILIIPGIEIKSRQGDILGLNVREIIPHKLSAKETIERIKAAGGTAIIPHAFGWFCGFKGDLEGLLSEIDGLEVLNASVFGPGNKIALSLAQKHGLAFTAGSDAHFPNFIGRAYLEIPGNNLTIEEVLQAVKTKNARVSGKEANFFDKAFDHLKRNLSKLNPV